MSILQHIKHPLTAVALIVITAALVAAGQPGPGEDSEGDQLRQNELPLGPGVVKPPAGEMAFPGEAAYRAELAKAEKAYVERVHKARQQYIAAIKKFQMRASMMPEAARKIEAEVKRVQNLPRPIVIPEPKAKPEKNEDAAPGDAQQVTVSLTAPSGLWTIAIQDVRQVGDELWVLSKLTQRPGMGTMALKEVSDTVTVPATAKRVRHFVTGKTWNWGESSADLKYIQSEAELGVKWKAVDPLKLKR